MSQIQIKVRVDDAHLDRVGEVAERLKKAGMRVEKQLDAIGFVTGTCDACDEAELERVPGVAKGGVSREEEYTIS
jgi:hypothetical protein